MLKATADVINRVYVNSFLVRDKKFGNVDEHHKVGKIHAKAD